jgi:hypothetical protein
MVTNINPLKRLRKKTRTELQSFLEVVQRVREKRKKYKHARGLNVRFVKEVMKQDSIKAYTHLLNILQGNVYNMPIILQYEEFIDQEYANRKTNEPA